MEMKGMKAKDLFFISTQNNLFIFGLFCGHYSKIVCFYLFYYHKLFFLD